MSCILHHCAASQIGIQCVHRYGPFWIVMTLIFVSAVVGNYSSYENYKRQHKSITGQAAGTWYYDVDKVKSRIVMRSQSAHFLDSPAARCMHLLLEGGMA